jgi:hypothetical protein
MSRHNAGTDMDGDKDTNCQGQGHKQTGTGIQTDRDTNGKGHKRTGTKTERDING